MKKYTKEDLKTFEKDGYGRWIFPAGDYSEIKAFPSNSNFGSDSRFGSGSIFGSYSRFENDSIFGSGSRFESDCTYNEIKLRDNDPLILLTNLYEHDIHLWFTDKNTVVIQCGCMFFHSLDETFEELRRCGGDDELELILKLIVSRSLNERHSRIKRRFIVESY